MVNGLYLVIGKDSDNHMSDNISLNNRYEKFVTFDEPIPFWSHSIKEYDRNDGNCLLFYPVMIRDMFDFYRFAQCLMTDHQSMLDKSLPFDEAMKILSMTTYEYLFFKTFSKDSEELYIYMFSLLLGLCFRDNYYSDVLKQENYEYFLYLFNNVDNLGKPAFKINGILYDSEDFESMREIISYQNDLELPDLSKSKKYRDLMNEAKRLRRKLLGNSGKPASLEEQIICLSISTGLSIEEINKLSIRKFSKSLAYIDKKLHYQIYMTAQMSGFVKFEEKIEYWMSSLETDNKDKDLLLDMGNMEEKLSGKQSNKNIKNRNL